ncbi:uncharacterized protein MONBRDRAFT_31806 [Monosiga brevicollis MX1]|uniref:Phosphatidate cytidylyltransferase, mitochondrial n=1 Tax=Monosiga brevicollis TaxID=81824 RepID=A9UVI2_MONBE|nr:uncharacterized protein MONBRDRAFT_31806 [Monosiga brevicollis MX1]EDQ90404.1 predicted protein [Monosiga brevicollis MX1]|eukprot:XP_001744455.1 hypothetical protein [Monosiga brevicollis MX1]
MMAPVMVAAVVRRARGAVGRTGGCLGGMVRALGSVAQARHALDRGFVQRHFGPEPGAEDDIRLAVGYGSGVFQQAGHQRNPNTMIDLILVVDDSRAFHERNKQRHRHHYSALGWLNAQALEGIQRWGQAKLYYNPYVRLDGQLCKYGVMGWEDFKADMTNWEALYASGRLHKPVHVMTAHEDAEALIYQNRRPFSKNKCWVLEQRMTCLVLMTDLYTRIASLSYSGDPRMIVGEKKGKVEAIVAGSFAGFQEVYQPIWQAWTGGELPSSDMLIDNPIHGRRLHQLSWLPKAIFSKVRAGPDLAEEEVTPAVAAALASTVRSGATTQTIKGLLTGGLGRSAIYAKEKLVKMFQ